MNLCPRAVPRELDLCPRGRFSESKPKATSEARPKAKNPRAQGFLAEGLAEDVAEGFSEENPIGPSIYS